MNAVALGKWLNRGIAMLLLLGILSIAEGAAAQCIKRGVYSQETYCFGTSPPPAQQQRPPPAPTVEEQIQGLVDSAEALMSRGRYAEALVEVKEALELAPEDRDANALLKRLLQIAAPVQRPPLVTPPQVAPPPVVATSRSQALTVVDVRGRKVDLGLPVPEQMTNSPAMEEWLRGMDAVKARDWVLALAWFRKGLQKDSQNGALLRAVDLAEFTRSWREQEAAAAPYLNIVDAAFSARENGDRQTYERLMAEIRLHPYYNDPQARVWRDLVFQRVDERWLAGGPKPYAQMTSDERHALTVQRLMGEALAEDCERIANSALLNSRSDDARAALRAAATLAPHIPYYKRYEESLPSAK